MEGFYYTYCISKYKYISSFLSPYVVNLLFFIALLQKEKKFSAFEVCQRHFPAYKCSIL